MIRVLIADDHTMLRKGLKQILQATGDIAVSAEAESGEHVLELAKRRRFDVIVLDISMPGMHGLDVLKQLKASGNDTRVLILSMLPEEQYALRCLRAGACGYVTKEKAPEELMDAIRRVAAGRKYISATLAEELAASLESGVEKPLHMLLSQREFQIARMISSGKTVREIAGQLSLSPKTVNTYRRRALGKMKMKSTAELMRYLIELGLIDE